MHIIVMSNGGVLSIRRFKRFRGIRDQGMAPSITAFPDLERRNNIVIGGDFNNKSFVGTVGHLTGTFKNPWLDVPATNKTVHLRTCEFHQIENEKLYKAIC